MLGVEHIAQLVDAMIANGVTTLEVKGTDYRVRLVRAGARAEKAEKPARLGGKAMSPGDGTFGNRGGDDGLAKLSRGAAVTEGEVLGYLCIGPVQVPVPSPCAGRIVGRLPPGGSEVRRGDFLFEVEPGP